MHRDLLARSLSLSMLVLLIVAGCSEEIGPSTDDRPLLGGAEDPIERPRRDAAGDLHGGDSSPSSPTSTDAGFPSPTPVDMGNGSQPPRDAGAGPDRALDGGGPPRDAAVEPLVDRAPPPPDAAPPPPPYDDVWEPHDLSRVDAYAIPSSAKIFAGQHPSYRMIPETVARATSNRTIRVPIDVYLIDSAIWTEPAQLLPYFALTRDYFGQARIDLRFTFREGPAPAWEEAPDQLHLYFTEAMMNPRGAIPDGFGNLPAGKAVLNDQLMNRPHVNRNPLFLPGKTIGHEIGHVLGLPHVNPRRFLMAQGTAAQNRLDLTAEESVIMRIMALHRFGGELLEE